MFVRPDSMLRYATPKTKKPVPVGAIFRLVPSEVQTGLSAEIRLVSRSTRGHEVWVYEVWGRRRDPRALDYARDQAFSRSAAVYAVKRELFGPPVRFERVPA